MYRIIFLYLILNPSNLLAESRTSCKEAFKRFVEPYQRLFHKLPKDTSIYPDSDVIELIKIRADECNTKSASMRTMRTIVDGISDHSGKIGVLLPLSGPRSHEGKDILEGMRSLYPYRGLSFNQRVVVRDTAGLAVNFERYLAELIFRHRVSIVIGGLTQTESTFLGKWSADLKVPSLILNQKKQPRVDVQNFFLYPNELSLTAALLGQITKKGYKRVAFLRPQRRTTNSIGSQLEILLKRQGIETTHNYVYTRGDYPSMESAAKRIFKIDPVERKDEFRKLVDQAKRKAKEADVRFNPSLVALSPIIDVDAIFIDDNFRTVRHYTKIFEFLGVEKIPLIGTPQWRSKGLVEPPNQFLEGAFFVDYIGDYRMLPAGIAAPTVASSYFAKPDYSDRIDYMIIGQHAIKTADRTLSKPMMKRYNLYKRIATLQNVGSRYFTEGPIFAKDHSAIWPSFVFRISGHDIQPMTNNARNMTR